MVQAPGLLKVNTSVCSSEHGRRIQYGFRWFWYSISLQNSREIYEDRYQSTELGNFKERKKGEKWFLGAREATYRGESLLEQRDQKKV